MLQTIAPIRGYDKFGSGYYGASRAGGSRRHKGVDYSCVPGAIVLAFEGGYVTKLGYPYGDDLSFRYVEVTCSGGYRLRYFYVEPSVQEEQLIYTGDKIGTVQSLQKRHRGITDHVHFEVILDGTYINPEEYLNGLTP